MFHGVKSPVVLRSILSEGKLMMPGDKLLDGSVLRSTKCAGRQDRCFYTSPTVRSEPRPKSQLDPMPLSLSSPAHLSMQINSPHPLYFFPIQPQDMPA